uniref:Cytochrome P450 n=1 Tax=Oryza barthii TaxID=65489 RepID=A0A0D3GJ47_9ORYZ
MLPAGSERRSEKEKKMVDASDGDGYVYVGLAVVSLFVVLLAWRSRSPAVHGEGDGGLRLPPGPWTLPVIGSLHHLAGQLPHRAMRDLARRHGPVMLLRIGEVPTLVVSSRDAAREDREEYLVLLERIIEIAGGFNPADLWPSSRLAGRLSGVVRRAEACRNSAFKILDGIIQEHQERTGAGSEDLVDVLLRIQKEGELQFPLAMDDIKSIIFDISNAGIETSGTTLQWAMAELIRNPTVMHKATAEVRHAFAAAGAVSEDALGELRYLQLVIRETLRRRPADVPRMAFGLANVELPLSSLLFHFDWEVPGMADPTKLDMTEAFGITSRRKENLHLRPLLRVSVPGV